MTNIAVMVDSAADLTPADAERLGIYMIPNTILMNGERRKESVDVTREAAEFFLENGGELQTIPIEPQEFEEFFSKLLKDHDKIFCILTGARLSQNYNNALQAARDIGRDRDIRVYDSRITTIALGRMAARAQQVANDGGNLLDIEAALDEQRRHLSADSVVPTLKYFRKGKRVSASRAILSTLLRLCPVMAYTDEGELTNVRTVRGRDGIQNLLSHLEERYGDMPVAVTIGLAGEDAEQVAKMESALQKSQLNVKQVHHQAIGPAISAHSGPGIYGFVVEPYVEGLLF